MGLTMTPSMSAATQSFPIFVTSRRRDRDHRQVAAARAISVSRDLDHLEAVEFGDAQVPG
jgi:hypothetical protein